MSSLENALKIVALLSKERPVLRVGEVCREINLPKSSVSRLLKTLADHGMLERESRDMGYVAGKRALILADLYLANHTLLDLIDVSLDALIAEFQFAAYAAVLSGPDIVILRVKHGTYPLRLVQDVGKRMPAHTTSIGRALLARYSDDQVTALLKQRDATPSEIRDVLQEMTEVRTTGVAPTTSTIIPGISALGVGVQDPTRDEMLGFSISYPSSAADETVRAQMSHRIRQEAHTIGSRLKDPYWARRTVEVSAAPSKTQTNKASARERKNLAGV
ncbi:IclR family transcriptional regulator [Microvirga antarctica]|uniref:IclR family transcriptional regulator n=1 Tax=Microvirga antarctica TaxID=2819233 RepID=UPI001B30CD74|nr:IclR family transcriptional regulator [Microvirga antarctica]